MTLALVSFDDRTIPDALKEIPQWVNWEAVPNGERTEKIPVCGMTGQRASSTNPDTWTDYTTAGVTALSTEGLGLGFVFTQEAGVIGIDLDKCRDGETGALEPWAEEIVRQLQTYTEVSPSGRGLHLFLRGALPAGKRKKGHVEVYDSGRFFTVTGQYLPGTPATIEERTRELTEFHAKYLAEPEPMPHPPLTNRPSLIELSDEEVLSKCRLAKNAAKFEALWHGNVIDYPSQSDADLALLGILKFYTQDANQLDRLFRQSGLMRPKWDEHRGVQTYGQRSVDRALSHVTEVYSSSSHLNETPSDASVSSMSGPSSDVWPEIQPINAELLPVEPLPMSIVPEPFRGWVEDASNRMQCPPDFVAAGMVVMAGSIVGAGCGIRPKRHDEWLVVPNFWGGVVGRPSMMKTPAIGEAMKPLDALEGEAKRAYDTAKSTYEAEFEAFRAHKESLQADMRTVAKGKAKAGVSMDGLKVDFASLQEPKRPVWRRYKTNDATIEKMAELQAENPRGVLIVRDELIGLFATWDKDGHEPDRAFYLEAWNGVRPYTSDRIGRGTLFVDNLCVSLFGGIQPAKLHGYLYAAKRGSHNDGMVQRLQLLVYPDEPRAWQFIDTPINVQAKQQAYRAVERLASMDFRQAGAFGEEGQPIPYYRFDEVAQSVFNEWLSELETKLRQYDEEPILLEHLGKYRSLMPALAFLFHVLDLADGQPTGQVRKEHAQRAAAWCEYLESHARRIYGLVTNITEQAAARLARKLTEGKLPDTFTVRDVLRKGWSLLDEKQVVEHACEELVSRGWLRERVTMPAFGQRGKTEYHVNPKVRAC